jgi:hypothetical protein
VNLGGARDLPKWASGEPVRADLATFTAALQAVN